MEKIQGVYPTLEQTTAKVEQLLKEGYRSDNITIASRRHLS